MILDALIIILSIFGLSFFLRNSDGPFGIMSWLRNFLIRSKYFGVFFYKLFDCVFCTGCHVGWIVYLISQSINDWNIFSLILWIFAGGGISLLFDSVMNKLYN